MITANIESGLDRQKAVEKAIDEAIKENLLGDFFKMNKAEVIGMCMTEFDEELAIRTWREDGRVEMAFEAATNMLNEGIAVETIVKCVRIPLEKVLELQKNLTKDKATV